MAVFLTFFLNEYTKASFPGLWIDVILPTVCDNAMERGSQYWTTFQRYNNNNINNNNNNNNNNRHMIPNNLE